jgi:hypothetical protein
MIAVSSRNLLTSHGGIKARPAEHFWSQSGEVNPYSQMDETNGALAFGMSNFPTTYGLLPDRWNELPKDRIRRRRRHRHGPRRFGTSEIPIELGLRGGMQTRKRFSHWQWKVALTIVQAGQSVQQARDIINDSLPG